jgi:hypothetical protein
VNGAIDSNFTAWKAFDHHYWPHLFRVDQPMATLRQRWGVLRYDHIGKGADEQTEQKICELLSER